ncbi:hypothetical protein Vretimale_5742 [Volvox reticuliferus]|uniref:Uncharacterized protein n=2 Tax=Volvox reticuliferus TaxID=1737510 RepID=A0A8J4G650_9CHLO|nr:hypothetical protein Vretimale_5742 [Volvox reticuliferus]
MKSGIEQLREEKYRFTIETQGLLYTSADRRSSTQDDGTAWSEDDSDRDVPRKKSPPLAQRMATELIRVLREGKRGFLTDDALERLLAGSLQSRSDVAGYDVAKDYIKQVLGQLYGSDNATSSKFAEPGAESKHSAAELPANASTAPNRISSLDSSSGGSLVASGPGPPLSNPMQLELPTAGAGAMAPPWTVTIGRGSAGPGVANAPAARGVNDDEMERPRPRPHHGRIKEQLDLLQNADQLAAIISVATTAATTAAAAAVKQTMQTTTPLPPGAYARMHTTGQPMYNLPTVNAAMGRAAKGALRRQLGAAADVLGDESPDPQPQQRHGALVSPHQRTTPMVLTRRQEAGASVPGVAQGVGISRGEHQEQGEGEPALGPLSGEVRLRRQRLRWSQRRGLSLEPLPAGAADGGRRATSPGEIHSANTTSTGNSNLRVVRLGTPRVTARTPTPGGSERDSIRVQRPGRPALVGAELGSGTQPVTSTGTATVEVAPRQATAEHVLLPDTADMKPVPLDNGITAIQQHQPAEAPLVVESVSPGGFFVTGGESVFTRARMAPELSARNREVDAKKVAAKDLKPASPRSRRAALPEDMQDAFRSTLAFISDPSTARVQQRPVPSWAALDDVEERKQAQREAEELLGGAFDYSAMKRELERAKRTSRLLQQAAGPLTPPASMGQVPIGGPELHAAGSRPRPAGGTRPAISVPANLALQPRGNFEGLLPPPHSVWDVDEAWSDLDQFTKAVEAEVAYRAAAAGPSRRGSPARTQAALRTSTITATTVSEKTVNAVRASDRLPAGRAISTATAAAPATGGGKEQSAATVHTGGRKRTASPGTEIAAQRLMAGAVERSPSPLRIERKTQASGPIRIAFGRRVDEPPKAAEGRTSRIRSGSPPKARVSHGGTRSRTRKVANTEAVVASPISLSAGDAVGQVLSALASALLSDGDEAEDESCVDPGNEMVVSAGGNLPGLMLSLADAVPCRDTHEPEAEAGQTAALAGEVARADGSEHTASSPSQNAVQEDLVDPSLPPQHAHQQQLVGHGSDTLGHPAEPSITRDNSQENSRKEVHSIQAASGVLGAAGSNASISTSLVRQLGTHPWPNTTAASRPRFQYVIDTAHPPITRLPAWAASAKVAEGAPAAYAAALGTAPIGLGLSTQPQQQLPIATSMPFSTTVTQPANVPSQPSSAFEIHASSQDGGDGNIIAATKASYAQFWQHQELQHQEQQQQAAQRLAFSAPLDLPSNTHILPQQAVASALAATDVSVAERGAPDSNQQWEGAVTRAVEDEVVGRLAVMQLAAQREEPMVSPQDVAGMLPPLLDMELSRRLVCDVLRDNLRSLIVDQQQQEHRQGPTIDEGAVGTPTLEEPDGQPSSITDATAASHPTAEISPRDNPLPTTMPAGRPLGLAMGALSSVPPPTVTPVPGVPASVVQNVLSEPHLVTARLEQETAALPSLTVALPGPTGKQSPTMSQGTQARVLQGRGVQAHGAEARGVQAYGVVEARAVQAHGMEARGTQAAGVQERGTQAAGIMDSSSQADPPLPHYLLQASLASGLSYGAGMPLPTIIPTTGLGARQPVLEQGGAALSMPRPFYLVPADGSQLPPTTGLYGPASGLAFPPYTRGEGSRPPFNIPGLSKLRDSSDVDSSTDSMDRHLQVGISSSLTLGLGCSPVYSFLCHVFAFASEGFSTSQLSIKPQLFPNVYALVGPCARVFSFPYPLALATHLNFCLPGARGTCTCCCSSGAATCVPRQPRQRRRPPAA